MKSEPVVPAEVGRTPEGAPFSEAFDDSYHPAGRAFAQAREVFLAGNGLPGRWQDRDDFVVLETGFGLGNNFLATWDAWRSDPRRSRRLVFVSIERHPLRREDLVALHADSPLAAFASQLLAAWPPLTPDLHRLSFDEGAVELLLAFGDVEAWLPELLMQVDAFFLDGFAPAKNPRMWQPRVFKALARLAAPGATAATWSAAAPVRQGLATAGFEVSKVPGSGGKWHTTRARYAPVFVPRHAPARRSSVPTGEKRVLIVGAGLAGCSAAAALSRQGWHGVLLDRHDAPARETSGNPAGLFHGTVHAEDGPHTRFNRAAALWLRPVVAALLRDDPSAGSLQGLLRIELERDSLPAMQALAQRLRLPADYVQALDAAHADRLSGIGTGQPAWFYPGAGWVRPAALAAHWLREAGPSMEWRGGCEVDRLDRVADRWRLLDAQGDTLDEADAVVLANAGDALRLLDVDWPLERVRGQLSSLPEAAFAQAPRLPVAGAGYVLPPVDGRIAFGATTQAGDTDGAVRGIDHDSNLAQLARLGIAPSTFERAQLQGRTGWRWVARDRLPLIGGVPDFDAAATMARSPDQPRFVPRKPGLFVFTALASRGIAWSSLGAEVLASWICGSPCPLEASLVDAVDPARFGVRAARRAASSRG